MAPEPTDALVETIRRLPKAELHQHLDGALRPETAVELAAATGIDLTLDGARRRLVAPVRCRDQADLLSYFELPISLLQSPDALRRAARELVEDMAADGVTYGEIRWAPRLHLEDGLGVADVIEAVAAGVADARTALGASAPLIGLVVTAMRSHPPGANVELAQRAAAFGPPVVGFDLAGPEADYPAPPHAAAFRAAGAAGLGLTAHAGETPGTDRIWEVLEFGVARVAHGAPAIGDEPLLDTLRTRGVTLDLCPTSNVQTGIVPDLAAHPVTRLHRAGVSVTISTDDRTVSQTTLSGELARVALATGMTADELAEVAINGFRRGFSSPLELAARRAEAARAWHAWTRSRSPLGG
ncbi:MAG TPA: adenosine deaminase [Candidatus Limnocylindria bacterium]